MLRLPPDCHRLFRYHRPILLLALLATLAGGWLASKLRVETDLAELLPRSSETVRALERMEEELGGLAQLRIVLETDRFPAAAAFARALETPLGESPYVRDVEYGSEVEFYRKHALLFLEPAKLDSLHDAVERTIEREKQRLNPLLVDDLFGDDEEEDEEGSLAAWEERYREHEPKRWYTNEDSTVLVVRMTAARSGADLAYFREMKADVARIVEETDPRRFDPEMGVFYGGNVQNRIDEYEMITDDILGTALYGVTGVFLIVLLYLRSFVGAALVGASLLASLSWTFGVTWLAIGQLNTITGFLFVILFGLGVDFGIHAFARYAEARRSGGSVADGLQAMVCRTGAALLTTALTTSGAFFALLLMDFKGFSELGFISGVGILFAFAAMVVLLPALIVAAENLGLLRIGPRSGTVEGGGARSGLGGAGSEAGGRGGTPPLRGRLPFARGVLGVAAAATLLAAYGFSRVEFEYDFTNLRGITDERRIVSEKTEGVFPRSESPAVILADSREAVEEIVEAVRERMRADTLTPTIAEVRSVFSLVPADQEVRLAKIAAIRELVEEEGEDLPDSEEKRRIDELRAYLAVEEPFVWEDLPESDRQEFLTRNGEIGNFVFIYPDVPLRDGRNAILFREDAGRVVTASGGIYHAASSNLITAEMLELIRVEGWVAGLVAAGAVFLLVLADFRRLGSALLVLSPLGLGVVWMGGLMALFGMKLNFFNIVAIPSVVGIGVDSGVHIFHRWREEGRGSLPLVVRRTGLTVAVATITTITGYSGLILARHPGLRSLGTLAAIGLAATLVAAVLVLPAMIQRLREERAGGAERAEGRAADGAPEADPEAAEGG